MSKFARNHGILVSLGTTTTTILGLYFVNKDKYKVFNSWTSNYEPSICAKWDPNWDHREPEYYTRSKRKLSQKDENDNVDVEKYTPKVCRHLILIRHGQYNLQGSNDSERYLTKLGREQAEFTGKRLNQLGLPYTEMIRSTMARAQETGSIISQFLPNVPITHCDLLREGAPIPPEPPLRNYKPERYFFEDGARIEAAFRKYFHRADPHQPEDSYHILVCHANVIRYLVCRALQIPAEAWLRFSLNHASITWITITPGGRCILRSFGDSGFMPPTVISST